MQQLLVKQIYNQSKEQIYNQNLVTQFKQQKNLLHFLTMQTTQLLITIF